MTKIPNTPPAISPISPDQTRPLWSVMIPVYNCAKFLPDALNSVLMQAIPEDRMQIEVIDDASTDADVEALVESIGKGRIKYYRQVSNIGSLLNFETCLNRSKGKLVHLLHGDDKVRAGYYNKIEALFKRYTEAGAAFTRYSCIDEKNKLLYNKTPEMQEEGILPDWLLSIGERQRIQYAAITVRRDVYEKLGAFFGIVYAEDWEMWVRIAKHYPVAYTPDILAEYRLHSESISGNKYLSGEHLQDLLKAMMLIQQHLPEEKRQNILKKSKQYYANYGLKIARKLWHKYHDGQIVEAHIKHVLKLSRNPKLYLPIAIIYLKLLLNKA